MLPGIGVAIALSVLDLLRRIVHPHDGVLGYVPGIAGMHDIDDHPRSVQVPGLVVYRYDSPLFFANADDFLTRARRAVTDAQGAAPVEWLLLNAEAISEIDLTAIDALEELRRACPTRASSSRWRGSSRTCAPRSRPAASSQAVGDDRIFPTLPAAVVAYAAWYERRHGAPPPGLTIPPVPPTPAG